MNVDNTETMGLTVRHETLQVLAGEELRHTISNLRLTRDPASVIDRGLPQSSVVSVRNNMAMDTGWRQEYWLLQEQAADVYSVDRDVFFSSANQQRFSRSACLRRPDPKSFAIRGFLSAVTSVEGVNTMSEAYGAPLRFASADIAAYREGDYLRRHADQFGDRCLGLVWFIGQNAPEEAGGELIIEGPTGECRVITPQAGSIGVIPIQPAYTHLVATVRDADWTRYSIATHFSRA